MLAIRRNNSPKPRFETDEDRNYCVARFTIHPAFAGQIPTQVTGEVTGLLHIIRGNMTRVELQNALGLKGQANFRMLYLRPALIAGLITMTIPDKPNSRLQRYRLTEKGRQWLSQHGGAMLRKKQP